MTIGLDIGVYVGGGEGGGEWLRIWELKNQEAWIITWTGLKPTTYRLWIHSMYPEPTQLAWLQQFEGEQTHFS